MGHIKHPHWMSLWTSTIYCTVVQQVIEKKDNNYECMTLENNSLIRLKTMNNLVSKLTLRKGNYKMWTKIVAPNKLDEFPTGLIYWANSGSGIVKMVD